ncbi:unnamed protein product, partial [Brachionus calyciflorus]
MDPKEIQLIEEYLDFKLTQTNVQLLIDDEITDYSTFRTLDDDSLRKYEIFKKERIVKNENNTCEIENIKVFVKQLNPSANIDETKLIDQNINFDEFLKLNSKEKYEKLGFKHGTIIKILAYIDEMNKK